MNADNSADALNYTAKNWLEFGAVSEPTTRGMKDLTVGLAKKQYIDLIVKVAKGE